jgi:hypothetical protein
MGAETGKRLTLVDVGGVGLLARLAALLLLARGGSLLAGILLLNGSLGGSRGLGGGLLVSGFGRHFEGGKKSCEAGWVWMLDVGCERWIKSNVVLLLAEVVDEEWEDLIEKDVLGECFRWW